MSAFIVTVRTNDRCYRYPAIARASIDLFPAAYDLFGACRVSVRPAAV
ncbi:MAG: hypothetical protein WBF97_00335 [Comamonas sp.]